MHVIFSLQYVYPRICKHTWPLKLILSLSLIVIFQICNEELWKYMKIIAFYNMHIHFLNNMLWWIVKIMKTFSFHYMHINISNTRRQEYETRCGFILNM